MSSRVAIPAFSRVISVMCRASAPARGGYGLHACVQSHGLSEELTRPGVLANLEETTSPRPRHRWHDAPRHRRDAIVSRLRTRRAEREREHDARGRVDVVEADVCRLLEESPHLTVGLLGASTSIAHGAYPSSARAREETASAREMVHARNGSFSCAALARRSRRRCAGGRSGHDLSPNRDVRAAVCALLKDLT